MGFGISIFPVGFVSKVETFRVKKKKKSNQMDWGIERFIFTNI